MDPSLEPLGPGSITLHLPAQFRYLTIARDTALEACQHLKFSEFDCYMVEMAVDEACTNIIEHSYHGETPAEQEPDHPGFIVEFTTQPGCLIIEFTDRGDGFEFEGQSVPGPEEFLADGSERGLGMYIIQRFVDRVEYQHDPRQGNRLRLTKTS